MMPEPRSRETYVRELDFGGLFEVTFKVFRDGWKQFIAIPLIVAGPLVLVMGTYTFTKRDEILGFFSEAETLPDAEVFDALVGFIQVVVVAAAVGVVLTAIMAGAVTYVAAHRYLGRTTTLKKALSVGFFRGLGIIGITFVTQLLSGFSLLLCIIPGLLLWTMWSGSIAAAIVEEKSPLAAMQRSWELVQGRVWPILGFFTVFVGILWLALIGVQAPGQPEFNFDWSTFEAIENAVQPALWVQITVGVLSSLLSLFTYPLISIASTVVYFSQRVRKEGFALPPESPVAPEGFGS
jgi:hypothetical protein